MSDDLVWRQNGEQATLMCGHWQARLDALRPMAGLSDVSFRGVPLAAASFLGVDLDTDDRAVLGDCYQRGGDFIARYLQTESRPFAVLVYWRAGCFVYEGQSYPRIDLVVSIETSLLDSRPRLAAVSNLRLAAGTLTYCGEGYLLAAVGEGGVQGSGGRDQNEICYVEMCYPGDSVSTSIEVPDGGAADENHSAREHGRHVRCVTRLFGQPLEKGVILRSRMRGLFVPREHGEEIARAARDELALSAPPLTT